MNECIRYIRVKKSGTTEIKPFRLLEMRRLIFLYNKNFSFYYTKSLRQALKVEIKHKKLFRKQEEWKDVKDPL
ncbi:hypothetical protein DXC04_01720 [Dorea sp. OM07-5]|nr:hypothetical protein DW125_00040 [Dorea sp. AM10-31]RHO41586.1 hypothetical protein DW152_06680 [Dorea sp. AM13-35]RHQ53658.1 hypothetical protein DWY31_12880 [Dorea sp. AF24-7LB]RHU98708.1 hypothetical protein DXC04_01720 [Dorea sp. OM07-5]